MEHQSMEHPKATTETGEGSTINKLSIDILDQEHRQAVSTAISNILASDIAEITYAQIVDGLPLASVVLESNGHPIIDRRHPIFQHKELCAGVAAKTREFRESFNASSLRFDSTLLFAFQAASIGSRAFNTRLVEIAAVSIHQIAVLLFQMDTSLHKDDGVASWAPPKERKAWWRFNPDGPPPTLFSHEWYLDHDQYPNGVGDMVGYWAESRIFGGVVLFDRRSPDSDAIFLHPDRDSVTYRICQLLDSQKADLLGFLRSSGKPPGSQSFSLPILPSGENTTRVDPEESIAWTGVYRDKWERKFPRPEYEGDGRSRDVRDPLNYPTFRDQDDALGRYLTRHERQ